MKDDLSSGVVEKLNEQKRKLIQVYGLTGGLTQGQYNSNTAAVTQYTAPYTYTMYIKLSYLALVTSVGKETALRLMTKLEILIPKDIVDAVDRLLNPSVDLDEVIKDCVKELNGDKK